MNNETNEISDAHEQKKPEKTKKSMEQVSATLQNYR